MKDCVSKVRFDEVGMIKSGCRRFNEVCRGMEKTSGVQQVAAHIQIDVIIGGDRIWCTSPLSGVMSARSDCNE